MAGSAAVGKRGPKGHSYTTERVVFRLHENVERLVDELRGCTCSNPSRCQCGCEDRSAFLTKLLAKTAKRDLKDLLVPNKPEHLNQTEIEGDHRRSA
ncbi:hypothetical protein IU414_27135 [Nocardia farcinica]|uniref:hypothetical protein n=1 Tax=Nocardia farcinica TaxID=37329 RepID=UPI0018960F4C|nr:hypothetical protein [Nocardia farcinica]MBF6588422.1 hypothetical protein [Nocardia farcinica]